MTDTMTPEKRSWNMSRIHSKDTSIEVLVRKWLYNHGYRYRKNVNSLPGKPDIVLRQYGTIIFVQGCFWHRHSGCKDATMPKTRTEFWETKFKRNVANDAKNQSALENMGFRVIVLWECEITKQLDATMDRVAALLGPPHMAKQKANVENEDAIEWQHKLRR